MTTVFVLVEQVGTEVQIHGVAHNRAALDETMDHLYSTAARAGKVVRFNDDCDPDLPFDIEFYVVECDLIG